MNKNKKYLNFSSDSDSNDSYLASSTNSDVDLEPRLLTKIFDSDSEEILTLSDDSESDNKIDNIQQFRKWRDAWKKKEKKPTITLNNNQISINAVRDNNNFSHSSNPIFITCSNDTNIKINIKHLKYPANFRYEIRKYQLRTTHCPQKTTPQTFGPHRCKLCSRSFNKKQQLYNHNRIHKKHVCNICTKIFCRQDAFQQHMDRHFDFKRYTCHHCGNKYHRSGLYSHKCNNMKSKRSK